MKKKQAVALVYSLQNTFVKEDIKTLKSITSSVYLLSSLPYKKPFLFFWNRLRELFFSLFFVLRAKVVFCWFNDYHAFFPLGFARIFGGKGVLIVGGYDAVADRALGYGIFAKHNWRQKIARLNYNMAHQIWVVDSSLHTGCPNADQQEHIKSGIKRFLPALKTPISVVPTGYDPTFWKATKPKNPKSILTVANIPDERTYKRKGIDLFMRLATSLPQFTFTLAGLTYTLPREQALPKNVTVLGLQNPAALRALYSTHTYYFQGSRVEGLPNVLCEAMLCECIPLVRNVFGMPHAVGTTGFVFNPKQQWNALLDFVTTSHPEGGKNARAQIKKNFSQAQRAQAFLHLIENDNP